MGMELPDSFVKLTTQIIRYTVTRETKAAFEHATEH